MLEASLVHHKHSQVYIGVSCMLYSSAVKCPWHVEEQRVASEVLRICFLSYEPGCCDFFLLKAEITAAITSLSLPPDLITFRKDFSLFASKHT